jgi:biotin carboxylase
VRFAAAATRGEVAGALDRVGYPAVVKPAALAGSRGVFLWQSPGDHAAWTSLIDEYGYHGPFLVEEYLRGPEYSVETLSQDGQHHVVGITQKQLGPAPLFVEVGHIHPAPLPEDQRRPIEELTTAFLTACGYRFGPAHTEVIWTPGGPRIVESQARLGGDRIPRLIELSTGLDVEREIFGALAGRRLEPASHTGTALVRFFTFRAGRVDAVHGVEAARRLGYVDELVLTLQPGETVSVVRDSKSRHGHVIVSGASPREALARSEQVLSMLEVIIDGTPARADGRRDAVSIPPLLDQLPVKGVSV